MTGVPNNSSLTKRESKYKLARIIVVMYIIIAYMMVALIFVSESGLLSLAAGRDTDDV